LPITLSHIYFLLVQDDLFFAVSGFFFELFPLVLKMSGSRWLYGMSHQSPLCAGWLLCSRWGAISTNMC